jgi:FkbM family methyltransferase
MHAIDELIQEATEASPGTVIHVGAGRGAVLEQYARLQPSRVVLVEGDPDTAQRLERAARPFPWAHVVAHAVAASDGPLTWHRYNLPALNGPMAVGALARHYPRLQREASTSVPGVALAGLLRAELQEADGTRPTLLVLDVPGQEVELVDSLGDALKGVAALVIRRCAAPMPGASTWASLVERLRAFEFDLVGKEADHERLWPVALFRFDARGHALKEVRKERDVLQLRVTQGEAELAAAMALAKTLAAAHTEEAAALKSATASAKKLAAEREAVVQQLTKAREEQAKQVEALTQGKAAAEKLAAEREAAVQQLTKAREEQAKQVEALTQGKAAVEKLAAEREAAVQQLTKAREEQAKQVEALTQGKAAAEKLAAERDAAVQQLTKAREEQAKQVEALTQGKAAVEKLAAEREAAVQQLTKAREEQAKQVEALTQGKAAVEKLAAEREAAVQQLTKAREEQAKQVEALTQGKAAAEKLAAEREAALQQLTKAREEQSKQVEALTQGKAAAEKLAAEREASNQQLTQARDDFAKQAEVLMQGKGEADKLTAVVTELQASLSKAQIAKDALEKELERERSTKIDAIAIRLATERDLRELRAQYATLVAEAERVRQSLAKASEGTFGEAFCGTQDSRTGQSDEGSSVHSQSTRRVSAVAKRSRRRAQLRLDPFGSMSGKECRNSNTEVRLRLGVER